MAINFPPTGGLTPGTKHADDDSGIEYTWTGVYWSAQNTPLNTTKPIYEELIPIGTLLEFPTDVVPNGWLPCDGQLVSRATYPDLYNELCVKPGFTPQVFTVVSSKITNNGHGLENGMRVRFFSSGGSLPSGINFGVDYYIVSKTTNDFRVSTTLGGTAITITGTGSGTLTYLRTLYGLGDGNTTFNVPDLRNDFTRGSSSTNFIGIHQDDTVGDFNVTLPMVNQTLSFYPSSTQSKNYVVPNATGSVYAAQGNGDETKPRNTPVRKCIKAFKVVTNVDLVDVQALVQPIQDGINDVAWKSLGVMTTVNNQTEVVFDPIPTTAKMLKLCINNFTLMTSGNVTTKNVSIRVGSGAANTWLTTVAAYRGSINIINPVLSTTKWGSNNNGDGAAAIYNVRSSNVENGDGIIELIKIPGTNTWSVSGSLNDNGSGNLHQSAGSIEMSATLNRLKIIFAGTNSTNNSFAAGAKFALWYL